MKNYLKNRDRAMDWMNSKKHDFAQGIAILKDASFKPGVVGVLERHGSGRNESNERLMYHMREFIRCHADPKAKEDTDVILGVVKGKELQPDPHENSKAPSMLSDSVKKQLEAGIYPEVIAGIISVYRSAFVARDKFLRILADLLETNDDATIMKRRKISDEMKELSDIMDKLYPKYEEYVTGGKVPADFKAPTIPNPEAFSKEPENTAKTKPAVDDSSYENMSDDSSEDSSYENMSDDSSEDSSYENMSDDSSEDSSDVTVPNVSKAELQKKRKSIATKILRAKNMLLYQTETKQEQENPLTDQKKVAKYQAKIDRLTKELHDIDMQIAALA